MKKVRKHDKTAHSFANSGSANTFFKAVNLDKHKWLKCLLGNSLVNRLAILIEQRGLGIEDRNTRAVAELLLTKEEQLEGSPVAEPEERPSPSSSL